MKDVKSYLLRLMNSIADFIGKPVTFTITLLILAAWFIVGIFMDYGETWFTLIDMSIFIVTFLLLFVIQSSQNADTQAIQLKLDEIIDSISQANDHLKGKEKELKK